MRATSACGYRVGVLEGGGRRSPPAPRTRGRRPRWRARGWRCVDSRKPRVETSRSPRIHCKASPPGRARRQGGASLLLGRGCQARYAEGMTFTVASYNIHKCAGLDRRVDLDRIAQVLEEIDADLVGLQEVFRPRPWSWPSASACRSRWAPRGSGTACPTATRSSPVWPFAAAVRSISHSPTASPAAASAWISRCPGRRGSFTSSTCTSGSRSASGPSRSACWCGSTSCTMS